jgi:hypothetical protein
MLLAKKGIRTRCFASAQISESLAEDVWQFFQRFVDRDPEVFKNALKKSNLVYLSKRAGEQKILGFSTVQFLPGTTDSGQSYVLIYTSFSALSPECRGQNINQRSGLESYLRCLVHYPGRKIYWFFLASTYISYLLLPRNFRTYWPRPLSPMPDEIRTMILNAADRLALSNWDAEKLVVHRTGEVRYKEGIYAREAPTLANPHVAFYAQANPGQVNGDTLACIAELSLMNWAWMGKRAAQRLLLARAPGSHGSDELAATPPPPNDATAGQSKLL